MNEINIKEINRLLFYSKETGYLIWKEKPCRNIIAGSRAGSILKTTNGDYIQISVLGIHYLAHRLIWFMETGEWPDVTDHIDGVGTNNKWLNLRDTTTSGNAKNSKLRKDNTTGIYGVRWRKDRNKWQSYIHIDGEFKSLAHTVDFFEACCARKSKESKNGWHVNHGRIKCARTA